MGLPIVRALLVAHRGEIELIPSEGGALFALTLPLWHIFSPLLMGARGRGPIVATALLVATAVELFRLFHIPSKHVHTNPRHRRRSCA